MNYIHTIEIEITNYCNANCEFCAHQKMKRKKGFIDHRKFKNFLQGQSELLADNYFYQKTQGAFSPKVVFGGLGEPLLHKNIATLVGYVKEFNFYSSIITNGSLLTPSLAYELVGNGLDEIDISLHTLNRNKYFKITNLLLDSFLNNLKEAIKIFIQNGVKVQIWRIKSIIDENIESEKDFILFQNFLREVGVPRGDVLGPSLAWERDGIVPNSLCEEVNDKFLWCHKIGFTFNIDWCGNVILCCNDYQRESVALGNAFESNFDYQKVFVQEERILKKIVLPNICKKCRRWSDEQIFEIGNRYNLNLEDLWKKLK